MSDCQFASLHGGRILKNAKPCRKGYRIGSEVSLFAYDQDKPLPIYVPADSRCHKVAMTFLKRAINGRKATVKANREKMEIANQIKRKNDRIAIAKRFSAPSIVG